MSIFIAEAYNRPPPPQMHTIRSKAVFREVLINIPIRLNNERTILKHKIENGQ